MGEFPDRIVAAHFVTPPEFAGWKLPAEGTGRIGGARLTLAGRGGTARLTHIYEQIPIRVLPLDLGPCEPALIYLVNPTAGLLDGDAHRMEIHAGAGTRAVITGQSATRIHPATTGFCTQQWQVAVQAGAVLVVLPGPAIPYAGSRFFQRVRVELAPNAQLVWADLWFAGRYSRQDASERFRFESLLQDMQVQREGKLVYRDRFHWRGPWEDAATRWHFADQLAVGTIFITGAHAEMQIPADPMLRTAVFTTAAGDTCFRCTGPSEAVTRCVVSVSLQAGALLGASGAHPPWLLSNHHLGRTHWFDIA